MAMTAIWTGMTTLSLLCALVLGRGSALAPAALEGAAAAVELALGMAGALCLWMGVMEVMARAGLAEKLAKLLSPLLSRLFPDFRQDRGVMDAIAANVSANLLGLGNAATPLGLEAARRMSKKTPGVAGDSLCMLVVCNTASIQLLPTTVAAVRLSAGCRTPFDILPALVTLLTVVAMLRASGAMEVLSAALAPVMDRLGVPPETVPLMLVRPISGSAALGVGSDLIASFGPDSPVGRTAAVMLGSTETTFYTIAVYFGAAGIKKTRYAIPAALCADLAGFFFAALTVRLFFG